MNDWLDYKGSGSARSYAANGLMSDSNISHGLFGIQTKKDKDGMANKQKNADIRLLNAYKAKKNNLEVELNKLKPRLKVYEDKIKEADELLNKCRRVLQDVSSQISIGAKQGRTQEVANTFERDISYYTQQMEAAESNGYAYRKVYRDIESRINKIENEILAMDQKITPLELSLKQRAR